MATIQLLMDRCSYKIQQYQWQAISNWWGESREKSLVSQLNFLFNHKGDQIRSRSNMWQSSCATQRARAAGVPIYSNSVLIFSSTISCLAIQSCCRRKWLPTLLALILGSVDSAASQAAWSLVAEQSPRTRRITSVSHFLSTRKTSKLSDIVTNDQIILPTVGCEMFKCPWQNKVMGLVATFLSTETYSQM